MPDLDIERALKRDLEMGLEEDLYETYGDNPESRSRVKFVKKIVRK